MFLKYKVDIPVVPGKLVRKNRGGHTYIEYEYDRIYDPVKQYTYPKRASIGRVDPEDPTRMTPNENFLKYFPDAEIPEEIDRSDRSPYLNIGTYVVLHKLIQDCKLKEILDEYMDEKDTGFCWTWPATALSKRIMQGSTIRIMRMNTPFLQRI